MGSYYYLAAQLPSLIYGQNPPMSSEAFREMARPNLEEQDAALLDLLDLDPAPKSTALSDSASSIEESGPSYSDNANASGSDFIDNWRQWERTLRLCLARQRSQKTKREGSAPVEPPQFPADAAAAAQRAVAAWDSPLEAELGLDKARWDAIEMFQGVDYFDRNTIYAFFLKLKLLERRVSFKVEEGFAEYKSLYASILSSVEPGILPGGDTQ